ncbi:nuclear transport factor 2 family protein [Dactylosporangium sp. NPDC049742]|uniref:nuclear transport factor 2 family protein n=1 Tax=Dactylosporangium sp. NPDC049742 TaxID=3154737 RepID=UPI0034393095
MDTPPRDRVEDDVIRAYRAQLDAMAGGDTDALDVLLDAGFTLTHITGYRQPKAEWLTQMRAGQFVYHGIEERSIEVAVAGNNARLVGRIVTDATVYGTRAQWPLQLVLDYARTGESWIALRSIATTW